MLLIYFDKQALRETERQECYMESTQPGQGFTCGGRWPAEGLVLDERQRAPRPKTK
jgi:hypothetical protein